MFEFVEDRQVAPGAPPHLRLELFTHVARKYVVYVLIALIDHARAQKRLRGIGELWLTAPGLAFHLSIDRAAKQRFIGRQQPLLASGQIIERGVLKLLVLPASVGRGADLDVWLILVREVFPHRHSRRGLIEETVQRHKK